MDFLHDRGWTAAALPAIGCAGLTPRAPRAAFRRALRERRRLSGPRAARRLQLCFQTGILPLERGPFVLSAVEIAPELLVLAAQILDRLEGPRRTRTTVSAHVPLMPAFGRQYKC